MKITQQQADLEMEYLNQEMEDTINELDYDLLK